MQPALSHSRIFMRRWFISHLNSDGLSLPWRLWAGGSGVRSRFRVDWVVDANSLTGARNLGEAEAIQRHLLRGEPVSWCNQGYAWVDQDAVGWLYLAAFLFVILPYVILKARTWAKGAPWPDISAERLDRPPRVRH